MLLCDLYKNGVRPRNLCIPDNLAISAPTILVGNVEGVESYVPGHETSHSFRNELKLGHPQGDFIEKRTDYSYRSIQSHQARRTGYVNAFLSRRQLL